MFAKDVIGNYVAEIGNGQWTQQMELALDLCRLQSKESSNKKITRPHHS